MSLCSASPLLWLLVWLVRSSTATQGECTHGDGKTQHQQSCFCGTTACTDATGLFCHSESSTCAKEVIPDQVQCVIRPAACDCWNCCKAHHIPQFQWKAGGVWIPSSQKCGSCGDVARRQNQNNNWYLHQKTTMGAYCGGGPPGNQYTYPGFLGSCTGKVIEDSYCAPLRQAPAFRIENKASASKISENGMWAYIGDNTKKKGYIYSSLNSSSWSSTNAVASFDSIHTSSVAFSRNGKFLVVGGVDSVTSSNKSKTCGVPPQ